MTKYLEILKIFAFKTKCQIQIWAIRSKSYIHMYTHIYIQIFRPTHYREYCVHNLNSWILPTLASIISLGAYTYIYAYILVYTFHNTAYNVIAVGQSKFLPSPAKVAR